MILEDSNKNMLIANLILDYGISANLILDYGISADPLYGAAGGPLKVQFFCDPSLSDYEVQFCWEIRWTQSDQSFSMKL